MRNTYLILVEKPKGKRPLGDLGIDFIEIDRKEVG
jgi:hypothetical protein